MSWQRSLGILLFLTLLATTCTAWLVLPSRAATLRVPQDYPTLQAAINAAHNGDTIQVAAGTYSENVVVNTSVIIQGEEPLTTIVDGGENDMVFNIQANNVELHNLTIRNGGQRYSGVTIYDPYGGLAVRNTRIINNVAGVVIAGDDDTSVDANTIEENIFINNRMYGIDVKYSTDTIVRDNEISESAYGIEFSDASGGQVVNNTIFDTSYGIYVPYSNANNISANTLTDNSWNIYLTYSNSNTVGNNKVSGGSVGIQVMRSEGNSIFNNTATDHSYGIYLGYCGANTISGNIASLNDWGIELYNSSGSTIKANTVRDNTWGFYVAQSSTQNYIYHNNILNNVKQVFQDIPSGQNMWRTPTTPYQGNYWSDYPGVDTNGDGVGDTHKPWQGVDWYPLMTPWGLHHDVAIVSVTTSATKAYVGEIVNVTVTVENQGTWSETFNVTAQCENLTYGILESIGTQEVIELAPEQNITLIFIWNTIDTRPCVNYTIKAETSVVPEDIDTSDNTFTDGTVKVKLPGDVNGDGIVNIQDLTMIAHAYGTQEGDPDYDPELDLNHDGYIDIRDLSIVGKNYGSTC